MKGIRVKVTEKTLPLERFYRHPSSEPGYKKSDIFDILSNTRRRYVLYYLIEHPGSDPIPLRDVVNHVTAWENGTEIEQISSADRKSVYTSIKQTHLPRLCELEIIEYDQEHGHVKLTSNATELQQYLEYVPTKDIPWSHYYLWLSVGCGVLSIAYWLQLPLINQLTWETLAVIFVILFGLSSLVQLVHIWQHRLEQPGPISRNKINSQIFGE